MVNEISKEIIELFLTYSDKKTITSDEFLSFRKQAVEEWKLTKNERQKPIKKPISKTASKATLEVVTKEEKENIIPITEESGPEEDLLSILKSIED